MVDKPTPDELAAIPLPEAPREGKIKTKATAPVIAEEVAAVEAKAPFLSDEDMKAIYAQAEKEVHEELVKQAKKEALSKAKNEVRTKQGLLTGSEIADEIVTITIDLAEYASCLRINMREYHHGHTYSVPRHVADSMREMMFRSYRHQNEIDGKSLTHFYSREHNSVISPSGAFNTPVRPR